MQVNLPPISGNSIPLVQSAGTSVSGGNGTALSYVWQASTDNVQTFNNVACSNCMSSSDCLSYCPGPLTQKTIYRRVVSGGGLPSGYSSNAVVIDVINAQTSPTIGTSTYSSNQQNLAFGVITIQGDQIPSTRVTVDFIAEQRIIVSPSSTLKPGVNLKVGSFCPSPPSGARLLSMEGLEVNEPILLVESNLTTPTVSSETANTIQIDGVLKTIMLDF